MKQEEAVKKEEEEDGSSSLNMVSSESSSSEEDEESSESSSGESEDKKGFKPKPKGKPNIPFSGFGSKVFPPRGPSGPTVGASSALPKKPFINLF